VPYRLLITWPSRYDRLTLSEEFRRILIRLDPQGTSAGLFDQAILHSLELQDFLIKSFLADGPDAHL